MNTPQESSRSQPGAFASPPTACDRYHEYTFGKRDIHWDQWLYKDDPRDVAADNSEEPILPDGDEEFVAGPENEGAGEAEASDASSSDDEKSWESDCNTDSHSEGKRITEDDMTFAKRLAVLTYPGEQFVQLPQFKRYLAELSREDMLSILRRDWELDKAVAKRVRVVTTFTFTHPSRRMQRIIERACGGTLEEESEAEFDLDQALRAKDVEALRGWLGMRFPLALRIRSSLRCSLEMAFMMRSWRSCMALPLWWAGLGGRGMAWSVWRELNLGFR